MHFRGAWPISNPRPRARSRCRHAQECKELLDDSTSLTKVGDWLKGLDEDSIRSMYTFCRAARQDTDDEQEAFIDDEAEEAAEDELEEDEASDGTRAGHEEEEEREDACAMFVDDEAAVVGPRALYEDSDFSGSDDEDD